MGVIFLLIGASVIVALLFLGAFLWAVKNGQYEDDYTPSIRMLFDKNLKSAKSTNDNKTNANGAV